MKTTQKELIWYVSITLCLTYSLGLYVWDKGGLGNQISRIAMYIPALTVIGLYIFKFKKPIFKSGDLGINFKGLKYWFIAPIVLTGLSLASYGISYLLNPDMFETVENIIAGLENKGFYWGDSIALGFLAIVLLNGIIGSIFNIPMFIGEELGWRAFMVPRLLKLFSPPKAFFIGATVWGLWHAIMIFEGLNYPNIHPILGVLLMILLCIPLGIIIQYYYVKSKSIFVAALAHAALNKSAMSMSFMLSSESYDTTLYGPTGIIGIIILSITAFILYRKVDWKIENTIG
jgi:membrane protease YdiL (CAAX protease family)